MKLVISLRLALCGGIAFLTNAAFAQPADYYPTRPDSPGAVFRTTVPKRNSVGRPGPPSTTAPAQSSAAAAIPATFSGSTYTVGPTISPTTTGPQAEEHVAVDPNNPNTLVAAISDFSSTRDPWGDGYTGYNTTKFAVSTDNGNSWQEGFVATTAPVDQGGYPITSDGLRWDANSDPVVAIDRSGRVYMANLYFNDLNNDNGFYVNVDDNLNDGVQFTAAKTYPVAKNIHAATYTFEDKPWLAVDNSTSAHAGTVYVSWTHYFTVVTTSGNPKHPTTRYTTTAAIVFSRSTTHGATWLTTPIQVSPANQNGTVQGSQVAVGPDGTVYVVWESASRQFLSKSTDGGQTFSPAVAISPVFNDLSFISGYRINSFPALAVDPVSGAVYVAYADQPSTSSRIEFIASYNQGASFTAPVALDDDNATGQRLMPGLAVDESGTVHCSWFDTRNSPDGSADYFDIYATYSGNGGTTFAPNARVTTATVNAGGIGFIGDYSGMAAEGGYAHPVWTSANCQEAGCGPTLQTASLILPGAERFLISATPAAQSVAPGANATFQVTIQGSPTFIAANDSIGFGVDGLPADGSFSFEPPSVTGSGSSTLTVNSATLGSHPLTITATSSGGALAQSVPVRLDVQNPDFSLSLNPTSATVPWLFVANGTGMPSWTVASAVGISRVGDFSEGVSLALSGLPSGSSYSFDPNPATGDASALTLTSARVPGTYALTVTGTGSGVLSGVTRTASATLVVLSAPTTVSVVSPSGAIGYATSGGTSGTKDLRMTVALLNNFGQPVAGATVGNTLTLKNSNGTTSYSGTATTASNGTVTFTLRNAPAGAYSVLVTRVTATGLNWDGLTPPNGYTKNQ